MGNTIWRHLFWFSLPPNFHNTIFILEPNKLKIESRSNFIRSTKNKLNNLKAHYLSINFVICHILAGFTKCSIVRELIKCQINCPRTSWLISYPDIHPNNIKQKFYFGNLVYFAPAHCDPRSKYKQPKKILLKIYTNKFGSNTCELGSPF
jgi:hypothetical protein